MRNTYLVFLNHTVTSRFSAMSAAERRRFSEKMRFLAAGIWEGGILVKKLAGLTRKVLFEARISKGDRVLFTIGRHLKESAVYVWALLKHDDVDRRARIGIPENAPFLDFPIEAEEKIDNFFLDALPEHWYTQEGFEDRVESDYGPQKWNILDDDAWERMLAAKNIEELDYHLFLSREQYSVLGCDPPLLVTGTAGSGKTTIALYYLSRKEFLGSSRLFVTFSPYLRDFAARLHRGLVKGSPVEDRPPYPDFLTIEEVQRRFIPPSSPLSDPSKLVDLEKFRTIMGSNPMARKFDLELLWEEIRSIIKGALPPYSLKRIETLAHGLISGGASLRDRQELAAELAKFGWFSFGDKLDDIVASMSSYASMGNFAHALGIGPQEGENRIVLKILEFLKKKREYLSRPMLSYEEYLYMGEKRAPNFFYDRKELYALATYYQKKLEEQGLYDEVDLVKRSLIERRRDTSPKVWELVVCDEIQDMTDTHLELLFDLCSNRSKVFFAGDERQIVNPSGFRWEAVRSRFFEAGAPVPDLARLSMNFRSSGSIVELGNALLDLKKSYIGAGKFEARETWKFSGKMPVAIRGIKEETILHAIRESGADRMILVRTLEEKHRLISLLGTELVFTILEAKGLEFDTVLLWKFCADPRTESLWTAMAEGTVQGASEGMIPHLRHELSLLYTAVARTRSILSIYDGEEISAVWRAGRLPSLVVETDSSAFLTESWSKASTPEAWRRQADTFFAHARYKAAAECYRNAGNAVKAEEALAWASFQAGDYASAAPHFEGMGDVVHAAFSYEKCGDLSKALELYARSGDKKAGKRLEILLLEQKGDFAKAGSARLKIGETDLALEDWGRGGEYSLLAAYHKKKKDYSKCAHYYEKAGENAKAAAYLKKCGEYAKAASLLFALGDYASAKKLFRKAGGGTAYLDFCKRSGRPELIAHAYLELGKSDDALRLFREHAASSLSAKTTLIDEANNLAAKKRHWKAAIIYTALDLHREAATEFQKAKKPKNAALEFSRAGCHYEAAQIYMDLEYLEEAVSEWKLYSTENQDLRLEKIKALREILWLLLSRKPSRGKTYNQEMANDLYDEACKALDRGEYINAAAIFILFKDKRRILECLVHLGDDLVALYAIASMQMYSLWIEYHKRKFSIFLDPLKVAQCEIGHYWTIDLATKEAQAEIEGLLLILKDILAMAKPSMIWELRTLLYVPLERCARFCAYSTANLLLVGKDYLQVLSVLKDYSSISREGMGWILTKGGETKALPVIDYLDELADVQNDEVLRFCKSFIKGTSIDSSILGSLTVDEFNWSYLSVYSGIKDKVVAFLLGRGMTREAADVLRLKGETRKAAELLESNHHLKAAALAYETVRDWDKAKALYASLGEENLIARLYEHKGDLPTAILLWKKLGFPKQVERLEKKMKKSASSGSSRISQGSLDL
jgi:tetratricopeptide (TPR) repeat protein